MKKQIFVILIAISVFLVGCPMSLPQLSPKFYINDVLQEGSYQTFTVGQEIELKETLRIAANSEGFANRVTIETIQNFNLFGLFSVTPINDPSYIAPKCSTYLSVYENIADITDIECRNPTKYALPQGVDQTDPLMSNTRSPNLSDVSYDTVSLVITTRTKVKLTKAGSFYVAMFLLSNSKEMPVSDWKNIRWFDVSGYGIVVK
jgi:hypothetical protein